MALTPELKQNIFYTVYFTVTHNIPVFVYGIGILVSAVLAILKPKRSYVLFLLGFIILLFAFEYQKHIVDGLKEQTINALITIQEHNLVRRIINIVLIKLLPIGMPVVGWTFIILGAYLLRKKK
ncbi:MAG: hypothetical protein WAV30_02250 [Microgenomates group bacterium]